MALSIVLHKSMDVFVLSSTCEVSVPSAPYNKHILVLVREYIKARDKGIEHSNALSMVNQYYSVLYRSNMLFKLLIKNETTIFTQQLYNIIWHANKFY